MTLNSKYDIPQQVKTVEGKKNPSISSNFSGTFFLLLEQGAKIILH